MKIKDVLMEDTEDQKRRRLGSPLHFIYNMISIEELLVDYFEKMGIKVEPCLGALMMEAFQPIMTSQEGIVEEANNDEESPDQLAAR